MIFSELSQSFKILTKNILKIKQGGCILRHQFTKGIKMNTYLIIFNLEGREQRVYVNAGTESQAQWIFEREYMFDSIVGIIEQ